MRKRLDISKTIITVICLNLIQIAAIAGIAIYSLAINGEILVSGQSASVGMLLAVAVLTVFLNSFFTIRSSINLVKADKHFREVKDSMIQVENLNNTLRAQRHDFMNHLQVVYGLMEMEEYKDAGDYIERIYKDIQRVNNILKTSNPAVNALLQAKVMDCEKRNITARLNVTTQLKELPLPAWELCRVLGNLIDNSIDAVSEKAENRVIEIGLLEDLKSYGFYIKDNGPVISGNILEKIFEPGYTTKGNKGEGMGLAITREIMNNYKGEIKVRSTETETVFEGRIPKQAL